LISLKGTKLPFHIGDLRVIPYEDRVGGEKEAIRLIQDVLCSLSNERNFVDSPVLKSIPEIFDLREIKSMKDKLSVTEKEIDILKAQLSVSEKQSQLNFSALEAMRLAIETLSTHITERQVMNIQKEIQDKITTNQQRLGVIQQPLWNSTQQITNTAFVIMPMAEEFDPVYDMMKRAGNQVGMTCFRIDSLAFNGPIIEKIFESINNCSLVKADLTGRNQNVMFELGYAQAMGKKTILLSQNINDVPFDIREQRILLYNIAILNLDTIFQQLVMLLNMYKNENYTDISNIESL
jgi:hypothetical protein